MKILIAEDDTFFQKFYKNKLQEIGNEVEVAINGNEAIEKIQSFKPDVLLLDIIMPEKNGFEVLEEIKQNPQLQTSVLVFSTLGQEKDIKQAMDLGAKGFVNKSFFDFDTLVAKINEVAGQ